MAKKSPKFSVERIYDAKLTPGTSKGKAVRVLVDRLWPRGVSRQQAAIDHWPKDATPNTELRKSWHDDPHGHEDRNFQAFKDSYRDELKKEEAQEALKELADEIGDASEILLLTAAKDPGVSHVPVIQQAIKQAIKQNSRES